MTTAIAPAVREAAPALAPAAPPIVRVEGLVKRFARRRPLGDVLRHPRRHDIQTSVAGASFAVAPGELFGLLGPNGAGKTTLFRMLATLVLPDEGRAVVDGHDVARDPAAVRRILTPVIADERSLNWRLSAHENLRLFAGLHGLAGAERERRIAETLAIVGLEDTGTKLAGRFSSGMRQRLLIGRALLTRPRVLLLDEPTRSLDPVSARALRAFLREELVGRLGCTVLLATHSTEEALELCDRVGVLHQGRLLAVGAARALAEAVGDRRYVLWTRDADHPAIAALLRDGIVRSAVPRASMEEGWDALELEVPGGSEDVARALSSLAMAGVEVARLERVPLSLADLIERIVLRGGIA